VTLRAFHPFKFVVTAPGRVLMPVVGLLESPAKHPLPWRNPPVSVPYQPTQQARPGRGTDVGTNGSLDITVGVRDADHRSYNQGGPLTDATDLKDLASAPERCQRCAAPRRHGR
jgi:hypothetical protein